MTRLDHENISTFYGAHVISDKIWLALYEYGWKGSLSSYLEDWDSEISDRRKKNFLSDIAHGMLYIQNSQIKFHGRLTPKTCLIDRQFRIKLTNFGYVGNVTHDTSNFESNLSLYTAPEILNNSNISPSIKSDVYSFAIIAHELLYDCATYFTNQESFDDLIISEKIKIIKTNENIRPFSGNMIDFSLDPEYRDMLYNCWYSVPGKRCDFKYIVQRVKIEDSPMSRLEEESQRLELLLKDAKRESEEARIRADNLLYRAVLDRCA